MQCEWGLPGRAAGKDMFSTAFPRLTLQGEACEQEYQNTKLLHKYHSALKCTYVCIVKHFAICTDMFPMVFSECT